MDPKTAAKITDPDLLKAFNEGRGADLEDTSDELRLWVMFVVDGRTIRATEYELDAYDEVLEEIGVFLLNGGEGYTVAIGVMRDRPSELSVSIHTDG